MAVSVGYQYVQLTDTVPTKGSETVGVSVTSGSFPTPLQERPCAYENNDGGEETRSTALAMNGMGAVGAPAVFGAASGCLDYFVQMIVQYEGNTLLCIYFRVALD